MKADIFLGLIGGLLVLVAGCSKDSEDPLGSAKPLEPKQVASHLQQAFATAPDELKQTAESASQALQAADYDRAVQTITVIKTRRDLSFEQGLAIHASEVSLEAKLIAAMEAGDASARLAYERLKKSRRN
jgi:hypothetical protein